MILEQIRTGFMKVACYLLGCERTGIALVIDPAGDEHHIVKLAKAMNLSIRSIVNTHGHPDHTCGNAKIKALTSSTTYMHRLDDIFFNSPEGKITRQRMGFAPTPPVDVRVEDGDEIFFGEKALKVIHTPGHTPGSICLLVDNHFFTGDTLFVGTLGRTDFPGGSSDAMARTIMEKIVVLPGDTIIWPGHYYGARPSSTIADEKAANPFIRRLSGRFRPPTRSH